MGHAVVPIPFGKIVKIYLLLGGLRNALGVAMLTALTALGWPLTLSLIIVMIVGFLLYIAQVRVSIGTVSVLDITLTFIGVFLANRILLWGLYEKAGMPIYVAQTIVIVLLSWVAYAILRRRRTDTPRP